MSSIFEYTRYLGIPFPFESTIHTIHRQIFRQGQGDISLVYNLDESNG